jgi:hypothetical protein
MNRIIKTYATSEGESRISFRTDDYSKKVSKFDRLIEEAQKDFPGLKREDIDYIVYGGDRIKRIPGIEFPLPSGVEIPKDYRQVDRLEFEI